MSNRLPTVHDGVLVAEASSQDGPRLLRVGTADWFGWLETASGFQFIHQEGCFTARKQQRSGHWYWYAYRRHDGRPRSAYLGRSTNLSTHHLLATARLLSRSDSSSVPLAQDFSMLYQRPADPPSFIDRVPLLVTKLAIPRPQRLVRTRACLRMDEAIERPLTIVSAPAGFGKTTLLAQWVTRPGIYPAWVALDEGDNDAVRLWLHVLAAFEPLIPGIVERVSPLLDALAPLSLQMALSALAGELVNAPAPTALVLDTCDVLHQTSQCVQESLTQLIEELPPHVHVILAGRALPALPLARLRAAHQLLEFHATDLCLTPEEIQLYFAESLQLPLTAKEATDLGTAMEGWIAGLKLAGLSLQGHEDLHKRVAGFSGKHHYIFDYLMEQVISRLPDSVRSFLVETSVVDRLTAPLCDAITETHTGNQMLAILEQCNLFVEPLDDRREWYRLYTPFRDALKTLLRTQSPARMPELYLRASAWYQVQGCVAEAIECAFQADDMPRAARLVEAAADSALWEGHPETVLTWISRLPELLIQQHPRLCIAHAEALLYARDRDLHLEICARRAHDARENLAGPECDLDTVGRDFVRGGALAVRAIAAAAALDPPDALRLLCRVLRALPETHRLHLYILYNVGLAAISNGDFSAASQAFSKLTQISEVANNSYFLYHGLVGLARVSSLEGRLREALRLCSHIRQHSRLAVLDATCGHAAVISGMVFYERNELRSAAEQFTALKGPNGRFCLVVREAYGVYIHLLHALGDERAALQSADRIAVKLRGVDWRWADAMSYFEPDRASLWLLQGKLDAVRKWAHRCEQRDEAARRVVERQPLYFERERIALARVYLAERNIRTVLALVDEILPQVEAGARLPHVLQLLVLEALAYDALGDSASALAPLARAVALAEPEGFTRVFVNAGRPARELLMRLSTEQMQSRRADVPLPLRRQSRFLETVLAAFGPLRPGVVVEPEPVASRDSLSGSPGVQPLPSPLQSQPLVEALSQRELEVLQLLTHGASNADIASELVIAIGTVKGHVSNILRKLGIRRRAQVLARVGELGLFPSDTPLRRGWEVPKQPCTSHALPSGRLLTDGDRMGARVRSVRGVLQYATSDPEGDDKR